MLNSFNCGEKYDPTLEYEVGYPNVVEIGKGASVETTRCEGNGRCREDSKGVRFKSLDCY
jgi:hypothetical protein